ncbi:hypothetical protein GCM10022240_26320 [Microbacterium kribbense]|uniref:MarR family transcriptional regulator n=1 Tax=Microbacterium kribbense TaxID=433645 RepID=A0ABP7GTP6_9MICO
MKKVDGVMDSTTGIERGAHRGQDVLLALPARLSRIHSIILQRLEVPLTFRQYRTISRVASGYSSMSQLAARANLTMAAVSEGVFALVKRDLLRTQAGVEDRRTVVLEATPAGIAAIEAGTEECDAIYDVLERLYWRATDFYKPGTSEKAI